jgi:hypothetical protein
MRLNGIEARTFCIKEVKAISRVITNPKQESEQGY